METATLELGKNKYKGILDMKCIKKIQYELSKKDFNYRIEQLFEELSKPNMLVVLEFILQSVKDPSDSLLVEIINGDLENIFNYINNLLEISLPKKKLSGMDEFESLDIDEQKEDWDFEFMQYLWYSELKRSDDFWSITPKTFNSQIDIHTKMNGKKEDNIEYI